MLKRARELENEESQRFHLISQHTNKSPLKTIIFNCYVCFSIFKTIQNHLWIYHNHLLLLSYQFLFTKYILIKEYHFSCTLRCIKVPQICTFCHLIVFLLIKYNTFSHKNDTSELSHHMMNNIYYCLKIHIQYLQRKVFALNYIVAINLAFFFYIPFE